MSEELLLLLVWIAYIAWAIATLYLDREGEKPWDGEDNYGE